MTDPTPSWCTNCDSEHVVPEDPTPCMVGLMLGLVVEQGNVTRAQANAYLSKLNVNDLWSVLTPYLDDLNDRITGSADYGSDPAHIVHQ